MADVTSAAQGRFTVALHNQVGEQLDKIGAALSAKISEQTGGMEVEFTRPQLIGMAVKTMLTLHQNSTVTDDTVVDTTKPEASTKASK